MRRIQNTLHWVIVVSAASHIFCCVLPTVFALASFVTGLSMFSGLFPGFEHIHHIMHDYEMPLLVFAAVMLAIGWGVQYLSWKIDCHDTGCGHGSCKPKKRRAEKVLLLASALFSLNLLMLLSGHI